MKISEIFLSLETNSELSREVLQSIRSKTSQISRILEDEGIFRIYLDKSLPIVEEIDKLINSIDKEYIKGEPISNIQKLALVAFQNWLVDQLLYEKMGHIILPTGQGKTALAVIISGAIQGKSIFITDANNNSIDQVSEEYKNYFTGKSKKSVGKIELDKVLNTDIQIGMFENFIKNAEAGKINFQEISIIFIDEGDINGLSKKRATFLKQLAKENGIIIVAMSATEVQASRKKIQDVFPDEILRIPMPESLPQLHKLQLLPNVQFSDIFINESISFTKGSLQSGIEDADIEKFLTDSNWIDAILDYHILNHIGETFIFGMRTNNLNQLIIEKAKIKGIYIRSFTGEESQEERVIILDELKTKKCHGIVGSRLIGRGLDIPGCSVVYNSLITYSPQLFWQLFGRVARQDFTNTEKVSKFITFLPKQMFIKQNDARISSKVFPLCSSTFFKKDYFSGNTGTLDRKYNLKEISSSEIQSVFEVLDLIKYARHYGKFTGKPEHMAHIISQFPRRITYHDIASGKLGTRRKMVGINTNNDVILGKEDIATINSYEQASKKLGPLTLYTEINLCKEIINNASQDALNKLLLYHIPIIIELSKNLAHYNKGVNVSDLIQVGVEGFLLAIRKYEQGRARLSNYVIHNIFRYMDRYILSRKSDFYIPIHLKSTFDKIEKQLDILGVEIFNMTSFELIMYLSSETKIPKDLLIAIVGHIERRRVTIGEEDEEYINHGTQETDTWNQEMRKQITTLMTYRLNEKQERIIRSTFGFGNEKGPHLSLKKTGFPLQITGARVRQIQTKTIRILGESWKQNKKRSRYSDIRILMKDIDVRTFKKDIQ